MRGCLGAILIGVRGIMQGVERQLRNMFPRTRTAGRLVKPSLVWPLYTRINT